MAVEKQVNIKVTVDGVDESAKKVDGLGNKVEQTFDKGSKASDRYSGSIRKNNILVDKLNDATGGLSNKLLDISDAAKKAGLNIRTALIATGVGALVVGLGLVIAYWDEIKIALSDTNFLLGKQIENLEKVSTELESQISILDKRMELNKLEGKSNEELQKQKLALIKQEQEINNTLIEKLEWQLENEKALAKELTLWEKIKVEALRIIDPTKAAALEAVSQLETNEKTFELQQRINDAKAKQVDLEIAIYKAQNGEETDVGDGVSRSRVSSVVSGDLNPAQLAEIENAKIVAGEIININKTKNLELQMQEEALAQAKVDIAQNTLALIGAIAGEGSKVGKAVAVAQATIQGIQGVQNAYSTAQKSPVTALFPGYPIVQAGLAAAFSAVQIKKILSTDPTGRTQPNLGGAGGGGGVSAPSFNVVGTSGVNQLAETLQGQNEPVQAYVVGSNVTTQQSMDRNIVETATIG